MINEPHCLVILNLGLNIITSMSTAKFLYECWAFLKKMNRNTGITTTDLLGKMEELGTVRSLHGTYIYSLMYNDRYDKLKEIYG